MAWRVFGGSGGSKARGALRRHRTRSFSRLDRAIKGLQPAIGAGDRSMRGIRDLLTGGMSRSAFFRRRLGDISDLETKKVRATGKSRAARTQAEVAGRSVLAARDETLSPLEAIFGVGLEAKKTKAELLKTKGAVDVGTARGMIPAYNQTAAGKKLAWESVGTIIGGVVGGPLGAQIGGEAGKDIGMLKGFGDKRKGYRNVREALGRAGGYYDEASGEFKPVAEQGEEFMGRIEAILQGKADPHTTDFEKRMRGAIYRTTGEGGAGYRGGISTVMDRMRNQILDPMFRQFQTGVSARGTMAGLAQSYSQLSGQAASSIAQQKLNIGTEKMKRWREIMEAGKSAFGAKGGGPSMMSKGPGINRIQGTGSQGAMRDFSSVIRFGG